MAIFDFSGAKTAFDAYVYSYIDHNTQLSCSPAHYAWRTKSNFALPR